MAWKTEKLGTFIDRKEASMQTGPFGTQLKASEYTESGIPVINVRNIGYGKIRDEKLEYLGESKAQKLKAHILKSGDIVFGRKGASDRHVLIDRTNEGWLQGSDCLRLRLHSPTLSGKFLSYYFDTSGHKYWMEAVCSFGATMTSLNQDIVRRIEIPVPPLPMQKKIAGVLSGYDDLIENNKRRIALLEKIAEEIYREWFVRMRFPGCETTKFEKGVPNGWTFAGLGTLCLEVRKRTKKKDLSEDLRYVGLEHMPRKSITLTEFASADSVQSDKFTFIGNDILFGKIRPYLHKIALASFDGTCSSDIIVLRSLESYNLAFVLFTVFSEAFVDLATVASKGTKMPRADWDFLKKQQMRIPNAELLREFQAKMDPVFDQMKALTETNRLSAQAKRLLLPRLVSGKLSIEDLDIQFPPSMREEERSELEPAYA